MRRIQKGIAALLAVFLLASLTLGTVSAAAETLEAVFQILDLTTNNRTNPQGLDVETPSFGWRMESNVVGQKQTGYHLVVKEKQSGRTVWDSGKTEGEVSQYIAYEGETLEAETDYCWSVTVYDQTGAARTSETAFFTTGLMADRLIEPEPVPVEDLTEFTVNVDFVIHSGCLGLLLGVQDSGTFLMWQVHAGDVAINPHRWTGGGLNQNYPRPSIKDALGIDNIIGREMHMTVKANNGVLTTLIDGTQIGDPVSVGTLKLGRLGFRQFDNEAADVDSISVRDKDGNLVFEDDFNDPSVVNFGGGTIEDGKLKMNNSRLVFQNADTTGKITAFTLEMDAEVVNDALGIVFGAQDSNNFFMWQLNAKYGAQGRLRPHRWTGGGVSELNANDLNAVFGDNGPILGTPCHVKIEVDNGVINTYMGLPGEEMKQVSTVTVEPFELGKIGFRQNRAGGDDEIGIVDNIKVTAKDGAVLFEDDFSDPSNPGFPSGTITEDGRLRVENALFFQNKKEETVGWSGAQWIGAPEVTFEAGKVPVFEASYTMQLEQGSTKAAALFCGNDFRLIDKTKNNYRVEGESYLKVELDASGLLNGAPAKLNVYRKGFCSGDYNNPDATTLLGSFDLNDIGLTQETMYNPIPFSVTAFGYGLSISVGGRSFGQIVANPTGRTGDDPMCTYLNQIGFLTEAGQRAVIGDYTIRTRDTAKSMLLSKTSGATYSIFEGTEGVSVDGGIIRVGSDSAEVKALADPSYGTIQMLRREITAKREISTARLYVTARGVYEMSVNGVRVGEDWFNPGFTQYDDTITYSTYDITSLMNSGENVIGARLSSGWWCDQMTFDINRYNYWGNKPSLLAKIVLTYDDGSQDIVVTDPSWTYNNSDSPIIYSGFFNGETYDARREAGIEGWDTPGYTGANWKQASVITPLPENANPHIIARYDDPVRIAETLSAKFDKEVDPGVYVYDMGTNMAGVPEIKLPEGKSGQKITIRYSEMYYPELDPSNPFYYGEMGGKLLTENYRGALSTDTYIMKGTPGGETYRPSFTFHGYRYIEISGFDEPIPAENIKGIVLSSVQEITADYESSNPLTNQLHLNIRRSLLGNHISIPTDCPQRDERMGWTGDAQVFPRTATYYGSMNTLYEGWENTIRDAQTESGCIPQTAPNLGWAAGVEVAWPAAIIIPTWEVYKQYGNTRLIEDNLAAMKAFLDSIDNDRMSPDSYLTKGTALTEHLALIGTDSPLCSNVLYAYMLGLFSKMAEAVGETELAQTYGDLEVKVKEDWNRVFIDAASGKTQNSGGGIQDTQASYALAIEYGVISDANRDKAVQYLVDACARGYNNVPYTITTGFIGTAPLLPALTRSGRIDDAYKMFEQTEFASWLYPVTQGATSIWERWNGYTIENGFSGLNYMNSFNHYAAGAVGAWMINDHVGITSDEEHPGFQQFVLQPTLGGDFTFVNGGYKSIYGQIESNWTASQGELTSYEAVVPANAQATLYLPVDESTLEGFQEVQGVRYLGMEEHNGRQTAKFSLVAGGYDFALTDGKLTVSVQDGYVTDSEPEPTDTDKTILNQVIAYAEAAQADASFADVIADVQASFIQTLNEAQKVQKNADASQQEIDAAWIALMGEIHKLGFVKGDATMLQTLYDYAAGLDMSLYADNQAKADFPAALAAAKSVLDDKDNMLAGEIDAAVDQLVSVLEQLRFKADKSILESLLEQAGRLDTSLYTAESVQRLNSAVQAGQAVFADGSAEQMDADRAAELIRSALDSLEAKSSETTTAEPSAPAQGDAQQTTANQSPATGEALPISAAAVLMLSAGVFVAMRRRNR